MTCPRCGSTDVNAQVIGQVYAIDERPHHGIIWWVFIGWWWMVIKWVAFGLASAIEFDKSRGTI